MTREDPNWKQLHAALLSAFPTREELQQLTLLQLGVSLDKITGAVSLGAVVLELIVWADAQGRLDELLRGARVENKGNARLKSYIAAREIAPESPVRTTQDLSQMYSTTSESPVSSSSAEELIAVLKLRAQAILDLIFGELPPGDISDSPEADRFSAELKDTADKFRRLHKAHIEAIRRGQTGLAHELDSQIHRLLWTEQRGRSTRYQAWAHDALEKVDYMRMTE